MMAEDGRRAIISYYEYKESKLIKISKTLDQAKWN